MKIKFTSAFTLIELLVVISIIGLLASVILVSVNATRQKSRDSKRMSDIQQLAKAFDLFYSDKSSYPTTPSAVSAGVWGILTASSTACSPTAAGCMNYLIPTYIIASIPNAPIPADGTCGATGYGSNTLKNDYQLLSTGSALSVNTYTISFCLGSQVGAYSAGAHTLTEKGIQ